ncbi:MAG: helix-turn-helix domain-containing protein [Kordiimonadaceae bacterium]|nr:helix-turn-helix domain-containing protein [Kordiimonadaceae bacterium]PCJ37786.1 MAG: IclR family transcriptional regulator [Cellvibrionales bacterium]
MSNLSKPTGRTSNSGGRVLRVMAALQGRTLSGVSNGELAKALGESTATINRCCNTLIAEGYAQKLDNGNFCLSIKLLQIAQAHSTEFARMQDRMGEINQRVLAPSR